ncbi:S1 domain-containing post-transcriptional regulator GSP13 [Domibacillus iocasae]|jgi:general stress protein 13|uniref:RNA-binding protein S1 n=1 Tax=Domibacillus iocasae TaxID=1714016 RepID=A0A1E7DUX9_9BACI|nr:S1 domain-containing post-transcriptional regulator GSP13 [Domibacillus iocasae]OES46488.1 RNA-binding protein S1 [Domibacillus iocasae]
MESKFEPGQTVTGKITGIQPYGAFVALEHGRQGLVHISEITHGFVRDIHDYLTVGDEITVKVLSVNEDESKISLSIRATDEGGRNQRRGIQIDDDGDGFHPLQDKLQEWIEQSMKEERKKG